MLFVLAETLDYYGVKPDVESDTYKETGSGDASQTDDNTVDTGNITPPDTGNIAPSVTEAVDLTPIKISSIKASNKAAMVKWKKVKNQKKIDGIEIQYSTDKTFKTGVQTTTAKKSAVSKKIKKLTSKKKYYIRIRAYKNDDNVKHVSDWSVKAVKVK